MHSAEARDLMVARVQEAFEAQRTIDDWPVVSKWDISAPVAAPYEEKQYVEALHSICAQGVPTGRLKDQQVIVGNRVGAEAPAATGKVLKVGK